jgi:AmmeMemoRadiSam system protein B
VPGSSNIGSDGVITVKPVMRHVEAIHYKHEGQDMFCLRDPMHYSDAQLHVSPDVFLIASMFDGKHDFGAIRSEFQSRFGATVEEKSIREVMNALQNAHFLDGPAFEQWRQDVEDDFRDRPVRDAVLAGSCYPEGADEIGRYLNDFFAKDGGPGQPEERKPDAKPLRGLLVPHIDLRRGGISFAHAYKALWQAKPPETVVILGVAHAGRGELFSLTKKAFISPLGRLESDVPLIDRLAATLGDDAFVDEYVHKGEHSIEIQSIWLQHIGGSNAPKIVPVLCGAMKECVDGPMAPRELDGMTPFIQELGAILREGQGRVLVMASVDLAHIGQKFGDEVPLTPRLLRKNREMDTEMLKLVRACDANGFLSFIRKEEDRRKVCGVTPIYVMLSALEAAAGKKLPGTLLHYAQSPEEPTQSLVSFASMVFE